MKLAALFESDVVTLEGDLDRTFVRIVKQDLGDNSEVTITEGPWENLHEKNKRRAISFTMKGVKGVVKAIIYKNKTGSKFVWIVDVKSTVFDADRVNIKGLLASIAVGCKAIGAAEKVQA